MYVYKLIHSRKIEYKDGEWICCTIGIGVYSSLENAQKTIEQYKNITGFKDYPDDFKIEKIEVDFDDYDFILRSSD